MVPFCEQRSAKDNVSCQLFSSLGWIGKLAGNQETGLFVKYGVSALSG